LNQEKVRAEQLRNQRVITMKEKKDSKNKKRIILLKKKRGSGPRQENPWVVSCEKGVRRPEMEVEQRGKEIRCNNFLKYWDRQSVPRKRYVKRT